MSKYKNLNKCLNAETEIIESNYLIPMQSNTIQSVFFEKIKDITLSRSQFHMTSFINFAPHFF